VEETELLDPNRGGYASIIMLDPGTLIIIVVIIIVNCPLPIRLL